MERGYGPQLVSIKTRMNTDLYYRFEELDDFIDIALFDHDEVGKDDRMGRVEIDLRELSREVSMSYCTPFIFSFCSSFI